MIPQYRPIYTGTPVHVHKVYGSIFLPSSGENSPVAKMIDRNFVFPSSVLVLRASGQ